MQRGGALGVPLSSNNPRKGHMKVQKIGHGAFERKSRAALEGPYVTECKETRERRPSCDIHT